jgi:hypothetical protein
MRILINERLSFGNESACTHIADGTIAVVHACKEPCHRGAVGYSTRTISSSHPNYLVLERGHHLYLNLIDPSQPLFMMPSFEEFLKFVEREIAERPVLIHCNQGESRAPSLTLLYMAKRLAALPNDSYVAAATEFRRKYTYNPGRGIETWLTTNCNKVN